MGCAVRRDEITDLIVAARAAKGLTWASLAVAIGKPVVWTTAALLGQHPLTEADARTVVELLDLPAEAVRVLTVVPVRAARDGDVPTDPTIYRLYEAVAVYGPALKELIHEQFGDGIMSAINFGIELAKEENPAGDRVVITFNGKFLPYEWH
jgi:cyanate lyase